ncbi:MAG: MotA/TolQ/ExbB proton channel family protein [Acidobacteria bacterium]|nr:MotA/TolQ/ExbB proton channel family protein [Acidobacteriota bacterium]
MGSSLSLAVVGATSILDLVMAAGPVAKFVLFLLLSASIVSWAIIAERYRTFRVAARETRAFLARFHGGARLAELRDLTEKWRRSPVVALFKAAFHEVSQLSMEAGSAAGPGIGRALDEAAVEDVQRMMERTAAANTRNMERSLTFLATTASTSPFIGLFGTVWGIMVSFQNIAEQGAASLETYAPGIAEALIATAAGLAAAVPAAVAYNSFLRQVRIMSIEMDEFQYDFIHLLQKRRRKVV